MKTSSLYRRKKDCCGCELCSIICSRNIIEMSPDEEGFLYPRITDSSKCVECHRCVDICPVKKSSVSAGVVKANYGGYASNEDDIKRSASGGFATVIGRNFISKGGVVYGVRYSEHYDLVEYSRADDLIELDAFRASKYVQAKKGDVYKSVKLDLKAGRNVLFIGLPCEIAALHNYLQGKEINLYTIALICHGPTSPKAHLSFCENLIGLYSSDIISFTVRHKKNAWKPYYIKAEFKNGKSYEDKFTDTDYDVAFKYLKRPSCSSCKFKLYNNRGGIQADIIIGDFHLAHKGMPQFNNWGSSQVSILSNKGEWLVAATKDDFFLSPISMREAVHYNTALFKPIPTKIGRRYVSSAFVNKSSVGLRNLRIVKFEGIRTRLKIAVDSFANKITEPLRQPIRSFLNRHS